MLEVNFDPFPELSTARLTMRRIIPADIPAIFELRSNTKVMEYIEHGFAHKLQDAEIHFGKIDDGIINNTGINWAITLKNDTGKMIGIIGLWRLIKEHYRAEIGYSLHPDHWRKGIMKEAMNEVMNYGFYELKLHSVEAQINPANIASATLLQGAGFKQEGYFKENYFANGKFGDTAVYSCLAPVNVCT